MNKNLRRALAVGWLACSSCTNGAAPQPTERLVFDLDFEMRFRATVEATRQGGSLDVAFTPQAGFEMLEVNHRYQGEGFLEEFPEAHARLYTAGFQAPAVASGPCGPRAISLAMSLSRRGDDPRVAGSLAAYCGANVFSGTPARIFRLSGKLRT